MKKTLLLSALLLGTVSLFVGCTAPNAMLTKTDAAGNANIKTITNNAVLATRIGVSRVSMTNLGDIKRASLALKNGWFYAQEFQYKIVWFDASGTEINPESATWKPIALQGREIKTVQSVAPNSGAVDLLIYMKKD